MHDSRDTSNGFFKPISPPQGLACGKYLNICAHKCKIFQECPDTVINTRIHKLHIKRKKPTVFQIQNMGPPSAPFHFSISTAIHRLPISSTQQRRIRCEQHSGEQHALITKKKDYKQGWRKE